MCKCANKDSSLESGFAWAKEITKKCAKTFYFVSKFFPRQQRYAAYSVYALCKLSDETVDDTEASLQAESLSKLKRQIASVYDTTPLNNCMLFAFKQTVNKYKIPKDYFDEILEGMRMDLNKNRYADFQELYVYSYRVAGVVGLIMLKIFGYQDKLADKYAENLGIALQLTNILRDIKEDFFRGRVYLPQDEMRQFGISQDHISYAKVDEKFKAFMQFQIKRARQYYADSSPGIRMIGNARSRLVALLIKELYSCVLNEIEKNDYDIFSQRAQVNNFKMLIIVIKTLIQAKYL